MKTRIIHGNALELPLEDQSVDLVITSPPYFALRSYRDGDDHYDGQIGSEATPQEFLEALWRATAEMARVLKPAGSIWVNLGDKYAGSGGHNNSSLESQRTRQGWDKNRALKANGLRRDAPSRYNQDAGGIPAKSLMGLPWRYALGCVDQLGLILRAEVIWSKPNGLPESVTDRVRRSHEQWFHFVKQGRYYSAVDEIREAHNSLDWIGRGQQDRVNGDRNDAGKVCTTANPLGKLPGSVWTIPSEPLIIPPALGLPDHFAAFPQEWPRRIILGWSPPGICTRCGEGRRPVVDKVQTYDRKEREDVRGPMAGGNLLRPPNGWTPADATIVGYACGCTPYTDHPENRGLDWNRGLDRGNGNRVAKREADSRGPVREYHLTGWTPAPTSPAIVLDPFCGTGTVPMVARALGRVGIGIDLSADYCRLAEWRVFHSGHAAKAEDRTWAERQGVLL